jgi:HEAT repeat protein
MGMTGRADSIPHLQKVSNHATNSETRIAAHYAIDALINEGVTVETSAISASVDRAARFRALLRIGTTEALDELEKELLSIESDESDLLDVGAVLLDPIRGPRIGEWMWRNMQTHHVRFWHPRWWKALRYVSGGRDVLSEYATDGPRSIRRLATATLATVDNNATSSMIERAMRSSVTDHDRLADLYLRSDDPTRAAAFLRNHMILEPGESCRMTIGRAFRRHPDIIEAIVPEMFRSPDAETRRCACEIVGWLHGAPYRNDLIMLAFEDRSMRVRQAALDAIGRQAEFAAAEELREELIAATGLRAFAYADALAETADPIVLSTNDDPICIWPAIAEKTRLLALHVEEKLEKCAKAVEKRAEEKTRNRERASD